jgi:hypothetical protein
MFEERKVLPSDFLNVLEELDLDEGMRIHDESGCVVFVTRSATEYCINISTPEERWFYANNAEEAYDILKKNLKEPLKIWLY